MRYYCITFYSDDYTQKSPTFHFPGVVFVILAAFIFIMAAGSCFAFYKLSTFKGAAAQTAVIPTHLTLEPQEMKETVEKLSQLIDRFSGYEAFLSEIFSNPSIYNRYSYLEFISNITLSTVFLERLSKSSNNLSEMAAFKNALDAEITLRAKKYRELIKYLDEQSIILAHTPSIWPTVSEKVTSKFGFRRSPFTSLPSFHEGADLESKTGMPVKATADGIVVFAGVRSGYGFLVTIDHGFGYMTRYAHNSKLLVRSGDIVKKGDTI
ncbi:MAG: M23 family metallopeptidase, partial [Deferribacteraceae bacterium]|nr:M23 family metallopeptidase [Deferribacteraceae bacterium]